MKCKNYFLAFFVLVAMAGGFSYATVVPEDVDVQSINSVGSDSFILVADTTSVLAGGPVHVNDDIGSPVVTTESFERLSVPSRDRYLFEVGWRS